MVHEPQLIEHALDELEIEPPEHPLTILVGHTHRAAVTRLQNVTVLNGGSVGAGGTGNLKENEKIGIARLSYETSPRYQPLAADLVQIDPESGSATARRQRLDTPVPEPAGTG